jgi:hypothetical protein
MRYVAAIWQRHRSEHPEERRLPPVLPLILHHGRQPWQGPRDLRALVDLDGLPEHIVARQPTLAFDLDDLTAPGNQDLSSRQLSVRSLLPLLHLQWLRRRRDTAALLLAWRAMFQALLATPARAGSRIG